MQRNIARRDFYNKNVARQTYRSAVSNGLNLPLIPMDALPSLLAACDAAFAGLDYGAYMDKADGLGYDDIAGFDYGYDEALAGITDIFSSVWSTIKSVGSAAWTGAKWVGTTAYTGAKYAVKAVSSIPKIATNAYKWAATARITYPVRWVVQAGKTVGKWVWNGVKWLFQSPTGQSAAVPSGVVSPTTAPSSVTINPMTSGGEGTGQAVTNQTIVNTGGSYGQQPEAAQYAAAPNMLEQVPGSPYSYTDASGGGAGSAIYTPDMTTAQNGQAVSAEQQAAQEGRVNPLYIVGGVAGIIALWWLIS